MGDICDQALQVTHKFCAVSTLRDSKQPVSCLVMLGDATGPGWAGGIANLNPDHSFLLEVKFIYCLA